MSSLFYHIMSKLDFGKSFVASYIQVRLYLKILVFDFFFFCFLFCFLKIKEKNHLYGINPVLFVLYSLYILFNVLCYRQVVELVLHGLKQGMKDFNVKVNLLLCCMRHMPGNNVVENLALWICCICFIMEQERFELLLSLIPPFKSLLIKVNQTTQPVVWCSG